MNGFELTSNFIDTVAWPVTTLLLAWFFRKQVGSVISALASRAQRLTKLSAPGVAAEFEADVVEAAMEVQTMVGAIEDVRPPVEADRPHPAGGGAYHLGGFGSGLRPQPSRERGPSYDDWRRLPRLRAMAWMAPRSALLEAHMLLERAITALAEDRGWRREGNRVGIRGPLMFLRKEEGFSRNLVANAEELTLLRNRAAHDLEMDLTTDAALLYIESVMGLIDVVERLMGPIEDDEAQPDAE